MNQQQFMQAVEAGLVLTNSDSLIPTRYAQGVAILQGILVALREGKLGLAPTVHNEPAPPSTPIPESESEHTS